MKKLVIIVLMATLPLFFVSCKEIVSKGASKVAKSLVRESAEETTEKTLAKGTKKAIVNSVEEGAEKVTKNSMKNLIGSNKGFKTLYEQFSKKISKDFADDITVESEKNWLVCFSKKFPNSKMKMKDNTIIAKAGSTKNSGPVNEFLNYLLPNKSYMVDDGAFIYKTDGLGRVIEAISDRSKAYKSIQRNATRDKNTQKRIVESLDGTLGKDDAGHLFANTTGGPNELINQVPMNAQLNRNGLWRKLERMEEDALKQGKTVVSSRKLIYEGTSKRPTAIEFITKIDGKETRTIVKNI